MSNHESTYRVGPRSLLTPGVKFRVTAGPYWITRDSAGKRVKIPLGERGTMTFIRTNGEYLLARNRDGATCVLYVGRKRKSPIDDQLVRAPYTIRGLVGTRKEPKSRRRKKS